MYFTFQKKSKSLQKLEELNSKKDLSVDLSEIMEHFPNNSQQKVNLLY